MNDDDEDGMGLNKIFEMLVQEELDKANQELVMLLAIEVLAKVISEITEPCERLEMIQEATNHVRDKITLDDDLDEEVSELVGMAKNTVLDICSALDDEIN